MKKLSLLLTLCLIAAAVVSAQNKTPANVQKDIDAIKKMEQDMAGSLVKGKADLLEKYASPNMRFTAPDGMRLSRDILITAVRDGSLKFTASVISDLHVIVFIDTAIATYDT